MSFLFLPSILLLTSSNDHCILPLLPQANATAATLTAEIDRMRGATQESAARAEEAQQVAREAAAEEEGARRDLHSAE
jgi:hypothetical protein